MSQDIGHGDDGMAVESRYEFADSVHWRPVLTVEKYHTVDAARFGIENLDPYETVVSPGNLLTTAGLTRICSLIVAAGGQGLTNTATRIGVGNSATAEAVGQTDLQAAAGAANRYFMTMDATFPSAAAAVITAKATFGTADGNFTWSEWCLDIGTPTVAAGTTVAATMLNRKVQSLGTKTSAGTWVATATITLS
jgi:hypothetical protein